MNFTRSLNSTLWHGARLVCLSAFLQLTAVADPNVDFTSPTDGAQILTLAGVQGTAGGTAAVQQVTFSIQNLSTSLWWDGTNFQEAQAQFPTTLAGGNWSPVAGIAFPPVCCGALYQLNATAIDAVSNQAMATITVQAETNAPTIVFSPLTDGETVSNLDSIGGSVTDDFTAVVSVTLAIHELDINGGAGRWWNGTNFQTNAFILAAHISGSTWSPPSGLVLPALNSGQGYELTATAVNSVSNSATLTITVQAPIAELTWDPGLTPAGTTAFANPNTNGGNYWFHISPHNPAVGVWRAALNVLSGEADVYLSKTAPPNIFNATFASSRPGSDGFVLDASQFNQGEDWYFLVTATTNAQWNLMTGDAFVYDLGPVAANSSSGTNASIGAERMVYFKTTVPADSLAWRLWLNGTPNQIYVRQASAPTEQTPWLITSGEILTQPGQMLVVPPFLTNAVFNTDFIGVAGDVGTVVQLDSRKHSVTAIPFGSLNNVVVPAGDFPYRTFRIQVPVQQIAWQLNLLPSSGAPNIAVRRDVVPNEFRNDAFSEPPVGVGASISLVPPPPQSGVGVPGLSDGTWFVTIYSTASFSCGFTNSNPVITDVHYTFAITNDAPGRVGWRYYRIPNIAEQLGSLGWELLLSNQVAGTEIAIRRNAVPGRWNRRDQDNSYDVLSPPPYLDVTPGVQYPAINGFLQQPGHQSDIWYVGVYTPTQALGNFILTGNAVTAQLSGFDGAGGSLVVANEPVGKWKFVRIDVPGDALGWDLRLVDVSQGNLQMVVCRDNLPAGMASFGSWLGSPYTPYLGTNWPSTSQWQAGNDWTGCGGGPMLAMGKGNPLETGTYYIGVQDLNNVSSYTLQSRGIGFTNYAIRVRDLNFSGSATNDSLPVTEGDYFRVMVPSNSPDWKLKLSVVTGDVLLKVQQDYLPNSGPGAAGYGDIYSMRDRIVTDSYDRYGGQKMMRNGDEQWLLQPLNSASVSEGVSLSGGTFYVLVASQGTNLLNGCEGPGNAAYTLTSGTEPVTVLPNTLSYGNDLVVSNGQAAGEMKLYQFNVPAGIAAIEVSLTNRTGNPVMYLQNGNLQVGTWIGCVPLPNTSCSSVPDPYGSYGGTNWQWRDPTFITTPNASGPFSLSVFASSDADAAYQLRLRAVLPTIVPFDGSGYFVENQPARQCHFFQTVVPANALGWDVRLAGITNGNPQMVVCRGALPAGLGTTLTFSSVGGAPYVSTNWPIGAQWQATADWTGCGGGRMLAMGMGNPLEPGTYYIGVQDPDNDCSYTFLSRGIGLTNYTIRVRDLGFSATATNDALDVGEADYYRVTVPSNAPNWKLHLETVLGEALLKVQQDFLPNSGPGAEGYGDVYTGRGRVVEDNYDCYGGQKMMKNGDEQWLLQPLNSQSVTETSGLPAGTFYVLVAGQGQTNGNCEGTGATTYTLASGTEPVTVLPDTLSYGSDLLSNNSQAGGEMRLYQFNVPTGIASIEVSLSNRLGNPIMYLQQGSLQVGTWIGCVPLPNTSCSWVPDPYGSYGGTNWQRRDPSFITIPNSSGVFSLSVFASSDGVDYTNASYDLRVRAVPPTPVAFDGGMAAVHSQPAGQWSFCKVVVPPEAVGWDVRLTGITSGSPQMVVRRDTLPLGLGTSSGWPGSPYAPYLSTNWPGSEQWQAGADWTGCGGGPMVAMGMGNPLEPGIYYIGVQDPNHDCSYTVLSRGIGFTNFIIRVRDLPYSGVASNDVLDVSEADYYRVTVPSNAPNWKLRLQTTGELLLKIQQDVLPNSGPDVVGYGSVYSMRGRFPEDAYRRYGGQQMMKPGDEQWLLQPLNWVSYGEGSNLPAATFFVAVASQGHNPVNNCLGTDSVGYILSSGSEPVSVLPNTLSYSQALLASNGQNGGEMRLYQFTVPSNVSSFEVALTNRAGNPVMYLQQGASEVGTWTGCVPLPNTSCSSVPDRYGSYGGTNWSWSDGRVITVPAAQPGVYSLSVFASALGSDYPEAAYSVLVLGLPSPQLAFSPELNGGGLSNVASGQLADNERAFYQVTVPAAVNGAPVLGWQLELASSTGTPSVRVRKDARPDDLIPAATIPFAAPSATISAPYLTPGTWYVEVKGGGSTAYSLTSSAITANRLKHMLWPMPAPSQTNVAPGLSLPLIGDSGIDSAGNPLPGDQGIDLKQGYFDFYAVTVPGTNAGLLRTELIALSGNPKVYLRADAAPTVGHQSEGFIGYPLVDRSLTSATTQYGNWVPVNGRYESQLAPGVWVLAVQASGNANARYRLRLSCGNPVPNGVVQDLALNGGSLVNQNLNGGDWRYYRVQIPDPAPANWVVSFSRSLGSARMFIRDIVPPGDGNRTADYSALNYNPGCPIEYTVPGPYYYSSFDLQTWARDGKNQGPYPRLDAPGTYSLPTPPLRPGSVYYIGVWSPNDTTFSVSSSTGGGNVVVSNTIPFDGGSVSASLPGHGSVRYRLDVPPGAAQINLSAQNSAAVVLSLEQGTISYPAGPAHWTSYQNNDVSQPNLPNASLDIPIPGYWPWLAGQSYYLTVTNTSSAPENLSLSMAALSHTPPLFAVPEWTPGGLQLHLDGLVGTGLVTIYSSTNLTSWTLLLTTNPATAAIDVLDSSATNSPVRFYRATQQQ